MEDRKTERTIRPGYEPVNAGGETDGRLRMMTEHGAAECPRLCAVMNGNTTLELHCSCRWKRTL